MVLAKTHITVIFLVVISMLLGVGYHFESRHIQNLCGVIKKDNEINNLDNHPLNYDTEYLKNTITQLVQQRNNISRAMNLKQQKQGQMECEEATRKGVRQIVSSTGGWCAQVSVEKAGAHKTDTKLVPVLAEFLKGKYVASFGDGPGRYKQLLTDSGLLERYDAYDGAPFSEKTSEGRVMYLDLTLPQYGLPFYDWVMSLEVVEHIPRKYERVYLDNIVRHAKEGVILSWARLGQGGYSHVNNRPFEYVKAALEKLGFEHDAENSEKLKQAATLSWLKKNTNVYRRKDLSSIDHIDTLFT